RHLALRTGFSVSRGREERRSHTFRSALPQEVDIRFRGRADEDEVGLATRQVVDVGDRFDVEHRGAFEVGGEHLAAVAGGEDVVQRDEAELAGMTRRAGDDDPLRVEQRCEIALVSAHARSSTKASTATGVPSTTMSGFTSALAISGCATAASDNPTRTSINLVRSTSGSPRNGPNSRCVARSSIISSASTGV